MILCGDFYQLPPVPDVSRGDNGEHCIKSNVFNSIHHFNLFHVHRQSDQSFIRDISLGNISPDAELICTQLQRNINQHDHTIYLFSTNFECDVINAQQLHSMPGNLYRSVDIGPSSELRRILAPTDLHLKPGCPVMLLINISRQVTNGMRGIVQKLDKKYIKTGHEWNERDCTEVGQEIYQDRS